MIIFIITMKIIIDNREKKIIQELSKREIETFECKPLDVGDIHLIPQKLSAVEFCLPSKLLGILAIGKPIIGIARKNSELGKILDMYGVRLANEESEEMSNAINKLIEDKLFRSKLSNKSKIYIEKFHEKENILNDIYIEVKKKISLG